MTCSDSYVDETPGLTMGVQALIGLSISKQHMVASS